MKPGKDTPLSQQTVLAKPRFALEDLSKVDLLPPTVGDLRLTGGCGTRADTTTFLPPDLAQGTSVIAP